MVHCPQCGAANPDDGAFCSECGAGLSAAGAGARCPMCGHSNPVGRDTCERCNARLTPLVASSPAEESPDLMWDDLPPSEPSVPPAEPPAEPASPAGVDATPDWLDRMRDSALSEVPPSLEWEAESELELPADEEQPADSLDWLRRLDSAAPSMPEGPETEPAELPDWLSRLELETDDGPTYAEEEPATELPVEGEVPDWLAELAPSGEAAAEEEPVSDVPIEGEVPDWLAELAPSGEAAAEEERVTELPAESEVPDWLADLAPSEEAAAEEEPATELPAEGEVPDWLAELAPSEEPLAEEESVAEVSDETEMPDWVEELALAAGALAHETADEMDSTDEDQVAEALGKGELLDWLAEMAPSEEAPAEEEAEGEPLAEGEVPDWLADLAPAEEPSAEEEAVAEPLAEDELPDWLADMAPVEEPSAEEEPAAELLVEDELPDWLADMAPVEEPSAEEEPAAEPLVEDELPDWLADMAPVEELPTEEEPAAAPLAEAEVPDWLADMAPVEEPSAEEEPAAEPLAEAEVPDWLADMAPVEEPSAEEEPAAEPLAEGEVPDWLADMAPVEEPSAEEEPAAEPLAEAEVPDWMKELALAAGVVAHEAAEEKDVAEEEAAIEPLAEPVPADAELPDWVTEMIAPEGVAPADEELVLAPSDEVEVPGWLLAPAEAEEQVAAPSASLPEGDLVQAEIPDWLEAMRPGVAAAAVAPEEERQVETTGLLAGIAGVVQPAAVVTTAPSIRTKPEKTSTGATMARARLWQELIARSTQPSTQELPQKEVGKPRNRFERWLVYAIVLLAATIPLAVDLDLSAIFIVDQPLTTEAGAAFRLIDEVVTQDDLVLMVFDYDPAFVGELHLQAESMLHHLEQRRARVIALSLTPEGAGLAQQLMDDILGEKSYQVGDDYINLGYLPGESVGIRSLRFLLPHYQNQAFDGTDLQDALVFDGGESLELSDMALTVVLTEKDDNLRWWVEQITVIENELDRELPLVAGVSAAIEALARPYYDIESPQIDGLVVGLAGAADYERELNWLDGPAHIRLNGQLVGQLAVAALIVLGMLIYGLFRRGESNA